MFLVTLPFTSIGACAMFFPSYLEYLPLGYTQFLLKVANAKVRTLEYPLPLGNAPEGDIGIPIIVDRTQQYP